MEWKKVSPELSDFLEKTLIEYPCVKKKMFGCPVYFVNDNMFAGIHSDNIFIRLSEEDRAGILGEFDEACIFEPMEGRKMKEYVVIPETILNDSGIMNKWLSLSFRFTSSLPPKVKRKK